MSLDHLAQLHTRDALAADTGGRLPLARAAWLGRASRSFVLDARWLPLAVALVTFVAFCPALRNEFVNWDDYIIFVNNPGYRGLGWPQIRWMFTTVMMGHWIPLTWLTHGLDYALWGMNPLGYHLTNVVIHAVSAGVFYLVAWRVIRAATTWSPSALRISATTAALFFAVHPLRVESVAWVTERRDVLSGLFFLLTVLAYLAAVDGGSRRRRLLGASLACYVLAFTAKSSVMMLPVVLVLLDVYPLRRLQIRRGLWKEEGFRQIVREKFPYFAVAAAGALVSYYAQAANFFITSFGKVPLVERPSLVLFGLWFYFSRTVLPVGLSPLYQLPVKIDPLAPRFLVPAIGVVAVTAIVIALRRRWPAGLTAWLYYVIVVSPVIGIVHSGFQLAHDRYSYLSCMSWAILAGAMAGAAAQARQSGALRPALARVAAGAGVIWMLGLGALAWSQTLVWRDTDTLWRFAVDFEPDCGVCTNNLGVSLLRDGHLELAKTQFERALASHPESGSSQKNLGVAKLNMGDYRGAVETFTRILNQAPSDAQSRNNLAIALANQGRRREALWHFELAATLNGSDPGILRNAGIALAQLGHRDRSLAYLRRAIALNPDDPGPRLALGVAQLQFGDIDAAREQYDIVRKRDARLASILGPGLLTEW